MKKFLSYLLTVIVTAVIVGGGFYWWQGNKFEMVQKPELETEEIKKGKTTLEQGVDNSKKLFENEELGISFQHSPNWAMSKQEHITFEQGCATKADAPNTDILKINLPPLGIFGFSKDTCTIIEGMHPGYTYYANKDEFNKVLADSKNQDWSRVYRTDNMDIAVGLLYGPPFFEGLSAVIFNPSGKYNTIAIHWYSEALQKDNYRAYADIDKTAVLMADPSLPVEVLEGVKEFYEILDTIKLLDN
jgi:hypothetical protein